MEQDQIYNQDCFQATTELADQSVDAVITDPPYPNRMHLFPDTLVDGLAMLYVACKKAKNYVVFFWNPFNVPPPPSGWHEVARNVWHKPDCRSITHYEVIVVWSKEPRQKVSRVWSIPILDYRSLHDWKPHPTQKPVRLLRYVLEQVTKEGDLVLDPFVGSGTTAVACKQMKRHYIGIEIDPKYAEIARDRLKAKAAPPEDQEPIEKSPTADETEEPAEPTIETEGEAAEEPGPAEDRMPPRVLPPSQTKLPRTDEKTPRPKKRAHR
jgi:site-specific DNA-methyltransferase (adenine-specific)